MRDPRRRRALAVAGALALVVAWWLASRWLEGSIRARVEREAARLGLVVHLESVRVGLWPLVSLRGLSLERAGGWALATDHIGVSLRPSGSCPIGRVHVAIAQVRLTTPTRLGAVIAPTGWDLAPVVGDGYQAALRDPARGLTLARLTAPAPSRFEVRMSEAPLGQVLDLRTGDDSLVDAGVVDGTVRIVPDGPAATFTVEARARGVRVAALTGGDPGASTAAAFGSPTDVGLSVVGSWRPLQDAFEVTDWRVDLDQATLSGSLLVANARRDPRVDLSLKIERLELARLLDSAGLDRPAGLTEPANPTLPGDLGSAALSARLTGRLAEPASLVVTQRLDFIPPRRPLPGLQKLRGDFRHDVTLAGGAQKAIFVSAGSPDFVALADVPPLFVKTLLLGEDSNFFGHRGIDLSEVAAALVANWSRGGPSRGASTITQQLAKNLFLSRERHLGRKLQELSLALLLETTLGKERILEIYLNVIEWGPGLYGLRPASRHYFAKEPADLSPAQMAFLVSLIPGPVKYQRSLAGGRPSTGFRPLADNLLAKLRSVDALSDEQYQAALGEDLLLSSGDAGELPIADPPP